MASQLRYSQWLSMCQPRVFSWKLQFPGHTEAGWQTHTQLLTVTELTGQSALLGMEEQYYTESIPTQHMTGGITVSEE